MTMTLQKRKNQLETLKQAYSLPGADIGQLQTKVNDLKTAAKKYYGNRKNGAAFVYMQDLNAFALEIKSRTCKSSDA